MRFAFESEATRTPDGVEIRKLDHIYTNGQQIFRALDLAVQGGDFCTLLGPSGSGKTTLLKLIAGLISPSAGRIYIGQHDVTNVDVTSRDIGFVFQHYALFPHMTVFQNIAFPLEIRRNDRDLIRKQVGEILAMVDLAKFSDRFPAQLSGGQQQRVAVARALVYRPRVLLLDEPLGALDLRLRHQLGAELRRIQKQTNTTMVYVTHDQTEAFLLSDKIVVMNGGRIHQIGAPMEVYRRPRDSFVAEFLGDTNLISGAVKKAFNESIILTGSDGEIICRANPLHDPVIGSTGLCCIRPEDIRLWNPESDNASFDELDTFGRGVVDDVVFLGSSVKLAVKMKDTRLLAQMPTQEKLPVVGETYCVGWRKHAPYFVGHE